LIYKVIEYVEKKKRKTNHRRMKPEKALQNHHVGPINTKSYESDDKKRTQIFSNRKNTVFKKVIIYDHVQFFLYKHFAYVFQNIILMYNLP
jgi:hypothetical protein